MPTFRVTVINQTFRASDNHELPSFEDARREGIKAALAIGADEVLSGSPFFAAEIRVEDSRELLGRLVVSVGASALQ